MSGAVTGMVNSSSLHNVLNYRDLVNEFDSICSDSKYSKDSKLSDFTVTSQKWTKVLTMLHVKTLPMDTD